MRLRSYPRQLASLLLALSSASFAFAQGAAPSSTSPAKDAPVQLTPFEVTDAKDTGFAAASSLAGGRLATDLRDTPVAYSVVTRDFIDALQLTNLEDAANWSTGNVEILDAGQRYFFGNLVYYNTRGFAPSAQARPMRNYFTSYGPQDVYDMDRVDFGRGPDSILYGPGTLGGTASLMSKRAQVDRPFEEIQASVGSWKNYRVTLDVNRPFDNGKAAVRADVIWQDKKDWRYNDFDRRKGAFLAGTVKPFPNTEVRVEGEYYTESKQVGFTNISDQLSGWDGKTTFNSLAPLSTLPSNANAVGIGRRGSQYDVYDPLGPAKAVMNYQFDAVTLSGGATSATPIAGFVQGSLPSFGTGGAPLLYQNNRPAGTFDNAIANSLFRQISKEFTMSPDIVAVGTRLKLIEVTLDQKVGENLYLEFAANRNNTFQPGNGENNRGLQNIAIDINKMLPNGQVNPNYLQPYADGSMIRNNFNFGANGTRGAIAYVMKPNRFGKFTFNALFGTLEQDRDQDYRYLVTAADADHRLWGVASNGGGPEVIRDRIYFNSPSRPIVDLSRGPIGYIDPVTGLSSVIQPRWVVDASRSDTQQTDKANFKYGVVATNLKFFEDRLVVLGAVRRDSYKFKVTNTLFAGDYPTNWDGSYRIQRPDAPADWGTLTYVPKDANGNPIAAARPAVTRPRTSSALFGASGPRDPLYANDRFQDDYNSPPVNGNQNTTSFGSVLHLFSWFNPSFNYAQTFNPPDAIVRINGKLRPPTVAKGEEFGWRMELLHDTLNINLSYYRDKEDNFPSNTTSNSLFNPLLDAQVVGDQNPGDRNIRGLADLPNFRDTGSRQGSGGEIEINWNPTKALRFTANYAQPKVKLSNQNPDTLAYISANLPTFKQIVLDSGGLVDSNNLASVDQSIPVNQQSPGVNNAVNTYNSIIQFQRSYGSGGPPQITDSQRSLNFFGDYTFQTTILKGIRIGAGIQWRGRVTAGTRANDTIVNPANPATAIALPNGASQYVYIPSFQTVHATLAYTWRLKDRRELQANLVVNNLLDSERPTYLGTVLRPRGGDYTSPAREAVLGSTFAFHAQPINYSLMLSLKL